MQTVLVRWSASATTQFIPARKGEEPARTLAITLCSVGCTVRVHESSTYTTLQAAQLERTSLNLSTGEALSALCSLTHSGLSCPGGKRLSKPLTPQPPEAISGLTASWGQNCPSWLTSFLLGRQRFWTEICVGGGLSPQLCLPYAHPVAVGCASTSSLWHTGCWSSGQQKASDSSCGLPHIFICIYFS